MLKLNRSAFSIALLVVLLAPGVAAAQAEFPEERPEPGFRVLGPRTVVSFVRQTLEPAPLDSALDLAGVWNTILHVSNTGNGALAAAAVFVSEEGLESRGARFLGIQPGQTVTFSVADLIGDQLRGLTDVARGIVILRFFASTAAPLGKRFSQMVSAELIRDAGPTQAPQIIPLEVVQPGNLYAGRKIPARRDAQR